MECRYLWYLESHAVSSTSPVHTDGVGFCWDPDDHVCHWDHDANTPDAAAPRCSTIPSASQSGQGCAPMP